MRYEEKTINGLAPVLANIKKRISNFTSLVDPKRVRLDLLEYLSQNYGFAIDKADLEKQRSFIALAAQFLSMKGNEDAFKALLRSYGFKSDVVELFGTDLLVAADTDGDMLFVKGSDIITESRVHISLPDAPAGISSQVYLRIPGHAWYDIWSPTPDPGNPPNTKTRLGDKGFYLYIDDYKTSTICTVPGSVFPKNIYGKYIFTTEGGLSGEAVCPLDSPKIMKTPTDLGIGGEPGDYVSFKFTFTINLQDIDVYAYDSGPSDLTIGVLYGDGGENIGKITGWVDYNDGRWYIETEKFPKLSSAIVAHYGQGIAGEYPVKCMKYDGTNTYVYIETDKTKYYRAKTFRQYLTGITGVSLKDRYRKWYKPDNPPNYIGSLGKDFAIEILVGPISGIAETSGTTTDGLGAGSSGNSYSEPLITKLEANPPSTIETNRQIWPIADVWIEDNPFSSEYNLSKARLSDAAKANELVLCNEFNDNAAEYVISSVIQPFFNMPAVEFERELLLSSLADSPYSRVSRQFFIELFGLSSAEFSDEEFFDRISKRILEITPISSEFIGFYYAIQFVNESPDGPNNGINTLYENYKTILQLALSGDYIGRAASDGSLLPAWTNLSSNVVGYYKFNGNVVDSLGNYNLTLQGSQVPSFVGSLAGFNQCIDFNGTPLTNSGRAVYNGFPAMTGGYSISGWFYFRDTLTSGCYIYDFNYDYDLVVITNGTSYMSLTMYVAYSSGHAVATSTQTIPKNQWVFMTFVHNGVTKKNSIYMNGVDITATSVAGGGTKNANTNICIGNNTGANKAFDGRMDYFMYWNIGLTADAVKLLYFRSTYELPNNKIPFGSYLIGNNTLYKQLNTSNVNSGIHGQELLLGGPEATSETIYGVLVNGRGFIVETNAIIDDTHILVSGAGISASTLLIHNIIDYAFLLKLTEKFGLVSRQFTRGYYLTDFAGTINRLAVLDKSNNVVLDRNNHSIVLDITNGFFKANKIGIFFEIEFFTV